MVVQILVLLFMMFIIPGILLISLVRGEPESEFKWLLKLLYTSAYIFFLFLVGPWDWVSYYLRYLLIGLYAVAAMVSFRTARARPFFVTSGSQRWRSNVGLFLELFVGMGLAAFALRGYFYGREPVHLSFPLHNGSYYIGQGGNTSLMNAHNSNPAQRFALDIVELNAAGLRAEGIYPNKLTRYEIYGETIYSPCDGLVLSAVDGLPDNIPPETNREHLAGNHVVIGCKKVKVLLAHMQSGSLMVAEGDSVTTGQKLGLVGNSGNTSEPHLHIHAVQEGSTDVLEGEAVPMLFDGKFPVRNTVFTK